MNLCHEGPQTWPIQDASSWRECVSRNHTKIMTHCVSSMPFKRCRTEKQKREDNQNGTPVTIATLTLVVHFNFRFCVVVYTV